MLIGAESKLPLRQHCPRKHCSIIDIRASAVDCAIFVDCIDRASFGDVRVDVRASVVHIWKGVAAAFVACTVTPGMTHDPRDVT